MFDAVTNNLMSRAEPLEDLDLVDLPQQLTEAYATIVSARIGLQDGSDGEALLETIEETVSEMRRLAYAQEAFVSVLPDRNNRVASAFVAGAAHHVCLLAKKLRSDAAYTSKLGPESIPPEVSAALLLLIAEASADASEMAKAIKIPSGHSIESALLAAIVHLANGTLQSILDAPLPETEAILAADPIQQATGALFLMLLKGIKSLAAQLLGIAVSADSNSAAIFTEVKKLCIEPMGDIFNTEKQPNSIYAGPLHLASLLLAVSKDLPLTALINIPAPSGVDSTRWDRMMRSVAKRRPYLWRNHREAIDAGYLAPGASAVVSFPTGAGKSTLAELKIATALLRGVKVVFLAPTLALVDQTARALAVTFPQAEVERERAEDAFLVEADDLPEISVMTPERCLAMLSFDRAIFAGFGLLIFDECHLLHPRGQDRSRRAVDAMLCLLNFTAISPEADLLLLSAMMKNAPEIAGWIESISGRSCLPLELTWKPTRQVRGCIVYDTARINQLTTRLSTARREFSNRNAPVSIQRQMTAQPFGFFCLRQTWQSNSRADYALLPLLDSEVQLATGTSQDRSRRWYLTPNANEVAASLAATTAAQKLKTLVFTQTIPMCNGAVKNVDELSAPSEVELTEEEILLYNFAVEEMGDAEHVYLNVSGNRLTSASACHHGLLLPVERHLHENIFKRRDGINVLIATSTLAQGMNLPSEVVLISGDRRFDSDAGKMEQLEAHELLNAAGRAGRAGEGSYGFVLVIPSKVIHFDNETSNIHRHWSDLKAIFSQSDQCLDIDDPFTSLLDQVHSESESSSDMGRYLLSRLPFNAGTESITPDDAVRTFLNRSFAAYRARQRNDQSWIESRIEAAIAAQQSQASENIDWMNHLAAASGIPVETIRNLDTAITVSGLDASAATLVWKDWMFGWLEQNPALLPQLIRQESLEGFLGKAYKALTDDTTRAQYALPILHRLVTLWMQGKTLSNLELAVGTPADKLGKCEHAREFVLRIVPELAYMFGILTQVIRSRSVADMDISEIPLVISTLGACVREGFDKIEKLALHQTYKPKHARVITHRVFDRIKNYIPQAIALEGYGELTERVKAGLAIEEMLR